MCPSHFFCIFSACMRRAPHDMARAVRASRPAAPPWGVVRSSPMRILAGPESAVMIPCSFCDRSEVHTDTSRDIAGIPQIYPSPMSAFKIFLFFSGTLFLSVLFLQYLASSLPGSDDAARRMVAPPVAQKGSQAGGGSARPGGRAAPHGAWAGLACHGSSACHAILGVSCARLTSPARRRRRAVQGRLSASVARRPPRSSPVCGGQEPSPCVPSPRAVRALLVCLSRRPRVTLLPAWIFFGIVAL